MKTRAKKSSLPEPVDPFAWMENKSGEMFYLDEYGKKSDAALHEAILAEGDHEGAFQSSVPILRRLGMTDEQIERVYGMKIRK